MAFLIAANLQAQGAAELETKLPTLTGLERARALAKLVDAYRIDQPQRALDRGTEALRLFATYPDQPAHVSTLNEMGWAHMTLGRYDSAAFYADSGQRFAARTGDAAGQARAWSNLGTLAQRVGDPKRAVDLFERALTLQRTLGNAASIANSLNNLWFVYSTDLADYGKSLSYHLEALGIRERLSEQNGIGLSLNNIGIVYARLRQFDRALDYFNRALAIRREQGNKQRLASTLNNIGDVYVETGDYARALALQREALALRLALEDRSAIALSHRNLGDVYLHLHRLDSARAQLAEALRIGDQAGGDKAIAVQAHIGLAAVERESGHQDAAERHARTALAIAESMSSREFVRRASEELAATQEAKGQLENALAALKRSKAVSDSIFSAGTLQRIATLQQQYEAERRARELSDLRRMQAELALASRTSERLRDAIGAAVVVVLLLVFFDYRRRVGYTRLARELSVTDALTGVKNRRYVEEMIDMDVAASVRRHRMSASHGEVATDADLVFFLIDLDGFKQVNDAHGHAAGDRLLAGVAGALQRHCRDSDVVVRWGGDEFLVIARFTDRAQAAITAQRLRDAVAGHVERLDDGQVLSATASIGYAAFPLDVQAPDAANWRDVITVADLDALASKRRARGEPSPAPAVR